MMTGKKPTDPMFEDGLDHHSFAKVALPGIVLLEVLTGKKPILEDDLDLHNFARKALPDRVMEIVDPLLLKDLENDLAAECLISMVRIGVACSMMSPQDRMDIKKVIDELNLVRDFLQGTRKRPTRRYTTLDLSMSWLVSLEKSNRQEESSLPNFENSYCQEESESYSQEESESYSQGEPCLPIFENSFSQEESWLPNFENPFSQEELWLPNFEKSYIYSEYCLGSEMSTNGDVYNYGILLLEMMTGKSPTNNMFVDNLHNFSRMALPECVLEIVDPFLQNNDNKEATTMAANNYNRRLRQTSNGSRTDCLISVIKIGVACSMESPQHRMNINSRYRETKKGYADTQLTIFLAEKSKSGVTMDNLKFGQIYAEKSITEYGLGSEVSTKGDIYSYGILLLEMMTGKKPTDPMFEDGLDHHSFARVALPGIVLLEVLTGKRPIVEDDFDLHSFARKTLPNRVMEIVDPFLLKDIKEDSAMECLKSMVRIGVACSMESPQDRMEIKNVIRELNLIRDILQGTRKQPT
ncbi:hypothetical protein F0562_026292 [Nyssa sinensis]|uniref:Protein kinase domain-containing protein n=1 Tax=Nyssa sinensis TaxID=561372 RepID=A0A5J5BAU5_9ASTE|nr:hypothetical protein F0562_026292 [Nyssa sinensis]